MKTRLIPAVAASVILAACQPSLPEPDMPQAAPVDIAGFPDLSCVVSDFRTNSADDRGFVQGNLTKRYRISIDGNIVTTDVQSDVFAESEDQYRITSVTETEIRAVGASGIGEKTLEIDRMPQNGQFRAVDRYMIVSQIDGRTIADNRWILSCAPV